VTLPEDYLRYPHRRHGMDQDRYDWSLLQRREPVTWPGGARVALWVVPALEFFPLDQKAEPFKAPGGMVTPYPDLRHYTLRDYGNRMGIPTLNGAVWFDDDYVGNPLVFCGCVGVMPRDKISGEPEAGDHIVAIGGRTGRDGIHGATFSSAVLDESAPVQAVQIGDPITQKMMFDFLLEARDQGLYQAITDNGAGGLSSSVGEMAQGSGGAVLDLARAPLKYAGLAPWEILISEAQERMTLAVAPEKIDRFLALASRRGVEATVLGEFTDSGAFHVSHGERTVAWIDMEFLHGGNPELVLEGFLARWFGGVA